MKSIRQSNLFAKYMQSLGWQAEKLDSHFVYIRHFPILGNFAKIPHPELPINISKILEFKKTRKIFRFKISPLLPDTDKNYNLYRKKFLNAGFKIEHSPFNPTTNYLIDLNAKKEDIFEHFSEAKRRAVRRAIKNEIVVKETDDLETFIKIRQHQYLPVWFLVGGDMRKLWKTFYPENAALLLTYRSTQNSPLIQMQAIAYIGIRDPIAGILLLFYNKVAYYWFASALPVGKKLFAPTLLVWEAVKLAKKRGCKIFDFEGVYDDRFPKASASWKGFTKFKEGFGGNKVVYMENFYI